MPTLVFDLEAIPDASLGPYESKREDAFPPPPYWQIVSIGCVRLDDAMRVTKIESIDGDEREKLTALIGLIQRHKPRIVTFGGRNYDLPVVTARAIRHGLAFPYRFTRDVSYRYGTDTALDLFELLSDFGATRNAGGLDVWARLCGLPGKMGVKGSDVEAMRAAGEHDRIDTYCLCDALDATGVLLRAELTRGIDRGEYLTAAAAFLAAVDGDKRLSEYGARINRPRLLLEEP